MGDRYKKTAIILSGGKGSRMGYLNKGELKHKGKTFIQYLLDKLENYAEVIIVSNTPLTNIEGIKVVQDKVKEIGPLGGIYTGLVHSKYEEVLILSCDTPFVEKSYLDYLGSLKGDYDIALTTCNKNYEPLISLYKKNLLKDIDNLINEKRYKISLLFEENKVEHLNIQNFSNYCEIKESIRNITTLEELKLIGGNI